jgi:hypothetical protein
MYLQSVSVGWDRCCHSDLFPDLHYLVRIFGFLIYNHLIVDTGSNYDFIKSRKRTHICQFDCLAIRG